jgi:anti-anti-sigma factor
MSRGGGQFGFSVRNGVAVVQVPGELDLSNQDHLRDCCRAAVDAVSASATGPRVVVDLSGTTYLDSSALGVFVEVAKQVASEGGWLRLASADSPVLRRVLEITQLVDYLGNYDSVDDAVGGPTTPQPSTIPLDAPVD